MALLAFPVQVLASVEGGPHDLIAQGYDTARVSAARERCNRCHLSGGNPEGFVPDVPRVLGGTWDAASLACFSCHDGTTIVSPNVDASLTAFHPSSHGGRLDGYRDLRLEDYRLPLAGEDRMACITCHDPHDNTRRPFLRLELASLCGVCHAPRFETGRGTGNRTGNHPVGPFPRAGSSSSPIEIGEAFRVDFPAPYPTQGGGMGSPGVHWDLGGHLVEGSEGDLACYTCHAVHGDELTPPRRQLLTLEPVRELADLFCEGCHAGQRGDGANSPARPNPGGTTTARTYHPCDDDSANGDGWLPEVDLPSSWPSGGGTTPRLFCPTCHAAHGASPEGWLTRKPVDATSFCGECHRSLTLEYHHPLGGEGPCGLALPPGVVEAGRLPCSACHRAHNAGLGTSAEDQYVPLLLSDQSADNACSVCHPEGNPTCSDRPEYRASHFLGDPAEAFGDSNPPLYRDVWPESGLRSRYGGGEESIVTCLSCHAFARGAVTSGDDGKQGFLLARSGNSVEWNAGEGQVYLCVGCHSVAPGTGQTKGHSHPMMDADGAKLSMAIVPPVTLTPALRVNCDSCHRPHEAPSRGGVYILEDSTSENEDPLAVHPALQYTELCYHCHDASKY